MDDDPRTRRPNDDDDARPDARELAWLERFLAGESDDPSVPIGDDSSVHSLASMSPTSAGDLRRAVQAALSPEGTSPTVDPTDMVARLRARLTLDTAAPVSQGRPLGRRQSVRRAGAALAWATAAAVMIMATTQSSSDNVRSVQLGIDDTGSYHTGPGQRLHVQFSDGVEFATAPNTSVRVGRSGGYRALYLRGAMYVDAHDDSSRPLIVHAANALLENAGARFTVRTDPEGHDVRIAVASGVVLAGDSGAPWHEGHVLTRGTLGLVRSRGTTETFRSGDPDDAVMWEAAMPRFAVDALPNGGDLGRP